MPETATRPKAKVGAGLDRKIFERRVKDMQDEFLTHEATIKDIKAYINPVRGFFKEEQPNQGKAIDHRTQLNGHPRICARTLGGGMTSGMTSPARPWFKLGIDDPQVAELESVKLWLDIVQERMTNVFSRSNIYTALTNVYEEEGTFGTGAMLITSDPDTVIRAHNYTIGEYWLSVDANGRVNGFSRRYWLQVSALVKQFGLENCSQPVQDKYAKLGNPGSVDEWVPVIHLIEENDQRIEGKKDFKNMAYRSIQWEERATSDLFLRVGGFNYFPVLAPRWQSITASDIWSKSAPGWDGLGDSKMLMKLEKRKMLGLDKVTRPPLLKDSMVGEVNDLPGEVTETSSSQADGGLKPLYQIKFDLNAVLDAIDRTEKKISKIFYEDLFMMLMNTDRTNITAREIAELHETKLLMLGPVLESQEDSLLDPLIDLAFCFMMEAGLIPEPPAELEGIDVKVEYISVLAQAQKMVGTSAIDQVVDFIGRLMTVWPESKDKLDVDEAIDTYAEYVGIPIRLIRSAEAVARIRKATADAMEAQQKGMSAMAMADGAKTLSQAKLGQDAGGQESALDAVIKQLTGKDTPKNAKAQPGAPIKK